MAKKTLIVVESPAKSKTINKYLGSKYVVEASVGHIKDLVKFRLGVDVENGFQPKYITIKGKGDVIKKLKQLAKNAQGVLIATDPDREGEAIAWHIAQEVKKENDNVKRVLFNEITKTGIKKGIEDPKEIDENLFMSQQARRVLDRLIGYKVSPFLSRALIEKTTKTLSAGRVQSVALRLLCERETEIRSFIPIEYWNINGDFSTDNDIKLKAKLVSFYKKNIKNPEGSGGSEDKDEDHKIKENLAKLHYISNEEQAKELIAAIKQESFEIESITKKKVTRRPLPPFTTSLLQQDASRRLGFSNKKTMMVAQKLYEGISLGKEGSVGLITYMRTDSMRISPEAQAAAIGHITERYGKEYVPSKPNFYKSKSSNVQDAHEAIRPTTIEYTPEEIRKNLGKDEAALYELIFNRFIASQMKAAEMEQTTINIIGGEFIFRATGSVIVFPGFLKVYNDDSSKENGGLLPEGLNKNQPLELNKVSKAQSHTKPKPRYTEASLVKELDELGIGRPSTYAQIVSTLVDREYVNLSKKTFTPTQLGEDVNLTLVKNFPNLFNVDFTAGMEKELDTVAIGKKTYESILTSFYDPFTKSLEYAEKHGDIPEIPCPKCEAPMVIRVSRRGRFLGCSNYPECTGTQPLPKIDNGEEVKKEVIIAEGEICGSCGKPMVYREGRYGRFLGCTDYPNCKEIKPISTHVKCPKCNDGELVEKYSPKSKKKFWGCSTYPKCDHLTNYEPLNEVCPKCDHYYLEIRYKKTDSGYEKYIKCPNCKENFDLKK